MCSNEFHRHRNLIQIPDVPVEPTQLDSALTPPEASSASGSRLRRLQRPGTSMPPYLAFQLYSVTSETPYLRARSPVFASASCSRRTAMICSPRKPLPLHSSVPSEGPDSNAPWKNLQWQVIGPKDGLKRLQLSNAGARHDTRS
jgi:hypothetical protein